MSEPKYVKKKFLQRANENLMFETPEMLRDNSWLAELVQFKILILPNPMKKEQLKSKKWTLEKAPFT